MRRFKLIVPILCVVPVLLGFFYVFRFGVNVPYRDELDVIPLFEKYSSGKLSFFDFYEQHAEHRIFFPRIVMLLLGTITHLNTIAELYLIEILLLTSLCIILLELRDHFDIKINNLPVWIIPLPFLVFTLKQSENMLWGFQITFLMVQTFSLLTFYLIHLLPKINGTKVKFCFTSAVVCGIIASFSSIMGLITWLVGILQIKILQEDQIFRKKYFLRIWTLVGIVVCGLYFFDYKIPENGPNLFYFTEHPINFIKYYFTLVGASLLEETLAVGILITVSTFICLFLLYKNKRLSNNSFWVAVLIFMYITVISISIGRAEISATQALSPRYVSFTIFIVISLYIMFWDLFRLKKKIIVNIMFSVVLGIIIISIPYSYIQGFTIGEDIKAYKTKLKFIFSTYESWPDKYF